MDPHLSRRDVLALAGLLGAAGACADTEAPSTATSESLVPVTPVPPVAPVATDDEIVAEAVATLRRMYGVA